MLKRYRLRDYDYKLVILVLAISFVGIIAIGSAKESLQTKQLLGVLLGFTVMLVLSIFNYNWILKFYWVMYIGNLVLLAGVIFTSAGDDAGGAQRWFQLGGLRFQPSETAKIILILFFAQFIMKHKEHLNSFKYLLLSVVFIGVPWILIYKQPDMSTSIVVLFIFCCIMYIGGLSYKVIIAVLAIIIPVFVIFMSLVLKPDQDIIEYYQRNRIMAYIHPEEYADKEAYQQLNSITAIGSGQLNGKGYRNNEISSVKNGNYILEPQTDFIFAVIGEEFGFKGSVITIVLLMLVSLECFSVAFKAKDIAGRIIAGGVGGLIAFQSFVNIGVATFLLPNTGLPLPFVSYGLTSLVSLYIGIGFVLNVALQRKHQT